MRRRCRRQARVSSNCVPAAGIALALALCVPAMAAAAPSTVEIQRNIQTNWTAVESLQSEYKAIQTMSREELMSLEEAIEAVKTGIQTESKEVDAYLESKTQLIELLTRKYIMLYRRNEDCKRICRQILERVLQIEKDIDEMESIHGLRSSDKAMSWRRAVLAYVEKEVEEGIAENRRLRPAINAGGDSLTQEYLQSSEEFLVATGRILQDLLREQAEDRSNLYKRQKVHGFRMRAAFDTQFAKLDADNTHYETLLRSLKLNAELQVAALISGLMKRTVGDVVESVRSDYDLRGGDSVREKNWRDLALTDPDVRL